MELLFKLLYFLSYLLAPLFTSAFVWYIYYRCIKRVKPIKGEYKKIGCGNFFKRIFVDFPRQIVLDRLTFDPDYFREYGLHMVCGEQGSGKTMTVVYLVERLKKMYPKLKVKTNFKYVNEDDEISHWRDITLDTNGIYGEVDCLDEIQNWFNSLQSKDFPPEFLEKITQQRKVRRCIIGTSQVFTRIAKPLREQTYIIYKPITLFGCLTIVRKYKPELSEDGTVKAQKLRGLFFFVQSEHLRSCYDTYYTVKSMCESGFKSNIDSISFSLPSTKGQGNF